MEYTVIVTKDPESGWYCGQCKQLPEAISQGATLPELMENMKEAISLAIECQKEDLAALRKNSGAFFRKISVPA